LGGSRGGRHDAEADQPEQERELAAEEVADAAEEEQLPSAQKALHFSDTDRQWVITAYSLTFGSLLAAVAAPRRVFAYDATGARPLRLASMSAS
jgi:hypothetical protein